MDPGQATKDYPVSYEIQIFVYRLVLKVIKDTGCSYDEAWIIAQKELIKRLSEKNSESLQAEIVDKIVKEVEKRTTA